MNVKIVSKNSGKGWGTATDKICTKKYSSFALTLVRNCASTSPREMHVVLLAILSILFQALPLACVV